MVVVIGAIVSGSEESSPEQADTEIASTPVQTIAPAKTVPPVTAAPKATAVPKVEEYSGCKGLEDLIPKLALPGTVTLSYYQVVQLGLNDTCDALIKQLNKPENLKR